MVLQLSSYLKFSIYTGGGLKRVNVKDMFECAEITETHVLLRCVSQDEVIKRLGERNTDIIAQNLVRQLLRIVTKDQALKLIQYYSCNIRKDEVLLEIDRVNEGNSLP